MGPATPSRFALNEASWSGTARSAGYEWTSEPQARTTARLTPVRLNHRRTLKALDGTPHTSRAKYTERLAEAGIEPSVGSVGDSYDNALAETVIGLFKAEVIHRRGPWRSFEAVEFATLEWVDWFNTRRLFEPIGNIPPAEAEARYYEQRETLSLAA